MGSYSPAYLNAVSFTLGPQIEGAGALSTDPKDPGNWTGGKQGQGTLNGTRWGLSAAAYPQLDIKGLTREQAIAIYFRDYWTPVKGDLLPPRLALVVFDAAVNSGVGTAVEALQVALGVPVDGKAGPQTTAAARSVADVHYTIAQFLSERAFHDAQLSDFTRYGKDWLRRCFLACQAAT